MGSVCHIVRGCIHNLSLQVFKISMCYLKHSQLIIYPQSLIYQHIPNFRCRIYIYLHQSLPWILRFTNRLLYFYQRTYVTQLTSDDDVIDPSHSILEPIITASICFKKRFGILFIDTNSITPCLGTHSSRNHKNISHTRLV